MYSIDLPVALALSGERPSTELLKSFNGVGLIRGEYIFRNLLLYPTESVAAAALSAYVSEICAKTSGQVTYRTMEVTEEEANVLTGVERIVEHAGDDIMGLRGVRRHIAYPDGLTAELRALGVVTQAHENLEIIAPFVTQAEEYVWFRDQVAQFVGLRTRVGTMIETPAAAIDIDDFLAAGCRKFVIGANDLTSLLAARGRGPAARSGRVPGFERLISKLTESVHAAGGTVDLAGYLTRDLLQLASVVGVDRAIVHYSDLPRLLGLNEADLPDLENIKGIKQRTAEAISKQKSKFSTAERQC